MNVILNLHKEMNVFLNLHKVMNVIPIFTQIDERHSKLTQTHERLLNLHKEMDTTLGPIPKEDTPRP